MDQACARADAVVALSEAAAQAFWDVLGVQARVISPGVDLAMFTPEPATRAPRRRSSARPPVAEPRKRVDLLIDAVRGMDGVRLILDRRGPEISEPFVELRDLDGREALAGAYREAWVSVLPSVNEAFGLVLAEALACGTPAVAAHRGGMPEVLGGRDDVGATFEGGPDELAAALRHALALHDDPETPARCREQAERFSTDRTADAYLALYEELLQRRRSRQERRLDEPVAGERHRRATASGRPTAARRGAQRVDDRQMPEIEAVRRDADERERPPIERARRCGPWRSGSAAPPTTRKLATAAHAVRE